MGGAMTACVCRWLAFLFIGPGNGPTVHRRRPGKWRWHDCLTACTLCPSGGCQPFLVTLYLIFPPSVLIWSHTALMSWRAVDTQDTLTESGMKNQRHTKWIDRIWYEERETHRINRPNPVRKTKNATLHFISSPYCFIGERSPPQ